MPLTVLCSSNLQRLYLQVGMGGTPISHRQELAGQAYSLRSRRVCGLRTERSEDVAKAGIAHL